VAGKRLPPATDGHPLEQDREPTPPLIGIGLARGAHNRVDHDRDHGGVGRAYRGVKSSLRLSSHNQAADDWANAALSASSEVGGPAVADEQLAQPAIGRLLLKAPLEEQPEALQRVVDLRCLLCDRDHSVELSVIEGVEQALPSWEATVHRADADVGLPGDLVVADFQSTVADQASCGIENALPIALGIPAQRSIITALLERHLKEAIPRRGGSAQPRARFPQTCQPLSLPIGAARCAASRSLPSSGLSQRWVFSSAECRR